MIENRMCVFSYCLLLVESFAEIFSTSEIKLVGWQPILLSQHLCIVYWYRKECNKAVYRGLLRKNFLLQLTNLLLLVQYL